jgi:hypothetical protein
MQEQDFIPVVYFFGYSLWTENPALKKHQMKNE